jgi:hypothetical protein
MTFYSMLRSLVAVVLGIVVLLLTSFAIEAIADRLMGVTEEQPRSVAVRLVTMAYSFLCLAAGAYVTAWVAGRAPVRHALIMGVVQLALTVLLIVSDPGFAPVWVWILTVVLVLPAAWCGGVIRARQSRPVLSETVRAAG